MTEQKTARRSEKAGVLNFTKEMVSALLMAFIAIVYVIQAFRIPTGSMENSLLVGDFLLGLKFMYGAPVLPFSYLKFPGITKPKPGDIIIFKYPGEDRKDYIKRCIAGPGQTVQVHEKHVIVDGDTLVLPPKGLYSDDGVLRDQFARFAAVHTKRAVLDGDTVALSPGTRALIDSIEASDPERILAQTERAVIRESDTIRIADEPTYRRNGRLVLAGSKIVEPRITYFAPLRIPAAGDTLYPEKLDTREFLFAKHLIRQEHPRKEVSSQFRIFVDGEYANDTRLATPYGGMIEIGSFLSSLDKYDNWLHLDHELNMLASVFRGQKVEYQKLLFLDGKQVSKYVVRKDNYFMMGDNRDNSMDSRFWGYLNANFVKAKAFILYFSLDKETPLYLLPLKIRWNRIGKLIRSWNGASVTRHT